MIDIDLVYRDSAPDPDEGGAGRIARRVMARLERRRRRIVAVRAAAAVTVLGMAALLTLDRAPAPEARVAAPLPALVAPREAPPESSTPARSIVKKPRRAAKERIAAPVDPVRRVLDLCERPGAPADEVASVLRGDVLPLGPAAIERMALEVRSRARSSARSAREAGWMDRLAGGLGRSGAKEAWPVLAAILESRAPGPESIEAAGAIGGPSAVPALERCLYLGDRRAPAAAAALGRIPGPEALAALLEAHAMTRGAGRALLPGVAEEVDAALRGRDEEMRRLLLDPGSSPRALLFQAIADLRAPAGLDGLVEALEKRPDLKAAARRFLAVAAGKDLGAAPEAWRRWLTTGALAPGEPPERSHPRVAALPSKETDEKA